MAKAKQKEKEQLRQEKVTETVSKTQQFLDENKKTIYAGLIALLVIGLAIVAWYKFYYQPKRAEAIDQMYPAEANFRAESTIWPQRGRQCTGIQTNHRRFRQQSRERRLFLRRSLRAPAREYENALDQLKKYKGKDSILPPVPSPVPEMPTWPGEVKEALGCFESGGARGQHVRGRLSPQSRRRLRGTRRPGKGPRFL